ncbi:MAG: hypothetical protein WDM96_06165 [Lacunisphaera sp.]
MKAKLLADYDAAVAAFAAKYNARRLPRAAQDRETRHLRLRAAHVGARFRAMMEGPTPAGP